MKRHLILALLMALGITLFAAPLNNIPTQITQPDGKVIDCFASGDEFYNYLHDANGFTIVRAENGYYCYATKDDKGKVAASPFIVGSVDPASVGLKPYTKISKEEYYARRQAREQNYHKPQVRNGKELNHGLYNNLVVFIRFAGDTYHNTSFPTVEAMFNDTDYNANSLHNYYHHASYNQIDMWSYFYPEPDGEVILSYEDIYPKQYYQPYNSVSNPIGYLEEDRVEREFSLLERAIAYIEDMVPESIDFDYNDDGLVDNVVFVCKGETGAWNSLLWPHRWWIFDRTVMLHDLQVYDFNLQLEQGGYFNVSTLCHEMFHSLGAPDLYHYDDIADLTPVGPWDLMAGTTEPPQQTSAYMKYKYGNWIEDFPVLNTADPASFDIHELESVSWEGGRRNGYIIPIGFDPNQFFFIEYRDRNDLFDRKLPGSGILIYLIDTSFCGNAGWDGNENLDEVYLFRPGGTPTEVGNIDHANFSEGSKRTSFNVGTDPYPFAHNQPYSFYDWPVQITDISATGDRMSFAFRAYGGEGSAPGPNNFVAHVNSPAHQVELSWESDPYAGYYNVYRDGMYITDVTDTTYVYPYNETDNGFHIFSVLSVDEGLMHVYSAESKTWVILGDYETIDVAIDCDSPQGTKGGELEVSFNDPKMKAQYFTVYDGNHKTGQVYVPANTEATFRWVAGFDPESNDIHVTAIKSNESGLETLFSIDQPAEGILATYTAAEGHKGVMPPQHLTAISDGANVQLRWTMPVEANQFKVYRDGKPCSPTFSGYEYLDDRVMRSGTHRYQVENVNGSAATLDPEDILYATVMNYYCEPPQNLSGTHLTDHDELQWEAPQFVGYGLIAYDDNVFENSFGSNTQRWGITIDPVNLAIFEGHPITHLEMFDCSEGEYTYTIYNGEKANNNSLIYTQQHTMTGTHQMVRFPLDDEVPIDVTLPLWIGVSSSGASHPIPYGHYVGNPNSCMLRSGTSWKPATDLNLEYTWLLRAYTSPIESGDNFSYNVYWGPYEGSDEQMEIAFENLTATSVVYNNTENTRYNVTAIWNGRETDFSNTIYLGPSVEVESISASHGMEVFPNPTKGLLNIQNTDIQHVVIYNITGQKVFEQTLNGDKVVINLTSLPKGIYMMNVTTKEGNETIKVVKQ